MNYCEKCFAEVEGKKPKCKILTYTHCIGRENCSSYKTKEQCELEARKCIQRIRNLPPKESKYISQKYCIDLWKEF